MKFILSLLLILATTALHAATSGDNVITKTTAVRVGNSTSNALAGGQAWFSQTQYTNCCSAIATTTNMAQYTLPASGLNATGDYIEFFAAGSAASISNRVQIVFGSETILDTGNRVNGTAAEGWSARGRITRGSSTTRQHAQCTFNGLGTPAHTNASLFLAQTTSVATVLKIMGGSSTNATLTNHIFQVSFTPAHR